jgi:lipoprotein signal peptidase
MTSLAKHIFHICIGIYFLYIAIHKNTTPLFMYHILLVLGLITLGVHLFIGYNKLKASKNPWVNCIHIFIIAPILLYIGYHKQTSRLLYYELLMLIAFAAIGYHSYYLRYSS